MVSDFRIMFISMFVLFLYLIISYIQLVFNINMTFIFKLFIYLFLFCSEVLGEILGFYSMFYYWDNLLHFLSSIAITYIGFIIYRHFCCFNKNSILLFMFTFCFSITFAVFWEFIEFCFDGYLNSDMQKDTIISEINTSYFNSVNNIKKFDISKTCVYADTVMCFNGYLDIGLFDTLDDIVMSMFGTLFTSLFIFITKKRLE